MDRGLKYLVNIVLILFFVVGCAAKDINTIDKPINGTIGEIQSQVVTLTVECYDGNEKACNKLPRYIKKLKILLKEENK